MLADDHCTAALLMLDRAELLELADDIICYMQRARVTATLKVSVSNIIISIDHLIASSIKPNHDAAKVACGMPARRLIDQRQAGTHGSAGPGWTTEISTYRGVSEQIATRRPILAQCHALYLNEMNLINGFRYR